MSEKEIKKVWSTIRKLQDKIGVLQAGMKICNRKAEKAWFVAELQQVYRRLHGLYAQVGL